MRDKITPARAKITLTGVKLAQPAIKITLKGVIETRRRVFFTQKGVYLPPCVLKRVHTGVRRIENGVKMSFSVSRLTELIY